MKYLIAFFGYGAFITYLVSLVGIFVDHQTHEKPEALTAAVVCYIAYQFKTYLQNKEK